MSTSLYRHWHRLIKNIGEQPKYWGKGEIIGVSQFLGALVWAAPPKPVPLDNTFFVYIPSRHFLAQFFSPAPV